MHDTDRTLALALVLLDATAGYAAGIAGREPVAARLEERRRCLLAACPGLAAFEVQRDAVVTLRRGARPPSDPRSLARAVGRWVAELFAELEDRHPRRFTRHRVRTVAWALDEEIEAAGFYDLEEAATPCAQEAVAAGG